MVFDGFLLISFYFFVFILPGTGIIFGIIELKNKISNKNAVSKKKNNRFGIYGIVSIFFIIFLLFFPIHTVLSLKYSKPESLLNYFEKNFDYFENYSFGYRKQVKLTKVSGNTWLYATWGILIIET